MKQRFAAWRAADIRKALSEGRVPNPPPSSQMPPVSEEDELLMDELAKAPSVPGLAASDGTGTGAGTGPTSPLAPAGADGGEATGDRDAAEGSSGRGTYPSLDAAGDSAVDPSPPSSAAGAETKAEPEANEVELRLPSPPLSPTVSLSLGAMPAKVVWTPPPPRVFHAFQKVRGCRRVPVRATACACEHPCLCACLRREGALKGRALWTCARACNVPPQRPTVSHRCCTGLKERPAQSREPWRKSRRPRRRTRRRRTLLRCQVRKGEFGRRQGSCGTRRHDAHSPFPCPRGGAGSIEACQAEALMPDIRSGEDVLLHAPDGTTKDATIAEVDASQWYARVCARASVCVLGGLEGTVKGPGQFHSPTGEHMPPCLASASFFV